LSIHITKLIIINYIIVIVLSIDLIILIYIYPVHNSVHIILVFIPLNLCIKLIHILVELLHCLVTDRCLDVVEQALVGPRHFCDRVSQVLHILDLVVHISRYFVLDVELVLVVQTVVTGV